MYYLKHLWQKMRHNSPIRFFFDGLRRLGIVAVPYYLVLEGIFDRPLPHLETGFEEYDMGYLGPEDMKAISAIPVRNISEKKLISMLMEGKKCFGIKYKGELAAFTWCDFDRYNFRWYKFLLKDNEAYLFDAYTLMPFRGKGIAPYIRYQFYKELAKAGRHRFYSISDCFNAPSIKFKEKMNAKFLELRLSVGLFRKWSFDLRLKRCR